MKSKRRWISRFLEVYAREKLTEDIARLTRQNQALQQRIDEREAYIAGLHESLRFIRRMKSNRKG